MRVFILDHERELEDYVFERKLIGVYSSEEAARAAIDRVKSQPGFRDYPDGFDVNEHVLDRDGWTEGFITEEEYRASLEEDSE